MARHERNPDIERQLSAAFRTTPAGESFLNRWQIVGFLTADSTMNRARELFEESPESSLILVFSLAQLAGRGREGRRWHSPEARGLYVTYGIKQRIPAEVVMGLSLVVGVAVARVIRRLGVKAQLKWPNDILLPDLVGEDLTGRNVDYKKLGGVLIEGSMAGSEVRGVLIGVGINLKGDDFPEDCRAISLEGAGVSIDLYPLLAQLSVEVVQLFELFVASGVTSILQEWSELSMMKGRDVRFAANAADNGWLTGKVLGVDHRGGLVVQTAGDPGMPHTIYSGAVELL